MPEIKIPGLITDKKSSKLTEAEVQAMRDKFAKQVMFPQQGAGDFVEQRINSMPVVFNSSYMGDTNSKPYGYYDYSDQNNYGVQKPFFDNDRFKKYGPSPSRHAPTKQDHEDWKNQLVDYMKPKRSSFEDIIDLLFARSEKEQFLIDAGYRVEKGETQDSYTITRQLTDGTIKKITTPLDELFLKEITVKFKNLLLAKAVLKLKL